MYILLFDRSFRLTGDVHSAVQISAILISLRNRLEQILLEA